MANSKLSYQQALKEMKSGKEVSFRNWEKGTVAFLVCDNEALGKPWLQKVRWKDGVVMSIETSWQATDLEMLSEDGWTIERGRE